MSSTTNPGGLGGVGAGPVEDEATPTHVSGMTPTRTTYRVEQVRARDLTDTDVALIAGHWREIADVHIAVEDDWSEVRTAYGIESVAHLLGGLGEDGPVAQVLIRFLLTGTNETGGIDDDFVLLDRVELVDVQAPNHSSTVTSGY